MISPDQVSQMESKVARLRELLTHVAAARPSPLFDNSGGSAEGFTKQMFASVSQLDAERVLVFSGVKSFEKWWAQALELEQSMQYHLGVAATSTTSAWLADSFVATAQEVSSGASEIASAAKSGTTWGVLAAVVVLLVAWRLS